MEIRGRGVGRDGEREGRGAAPLVRIVPFWLNEFIAYARANRNSCAIHDTVKTCRVNTQRLYAFVLNSNICN